MTGSLDFVNPLEDKTFTKMPDPCVLVIFGVTGDLAAKRLLPALYNLARDGQLPSHFACVGFARREKTNEQFRQEIYDDLCKYSRTQPVNEEVWSLFAEQLFYHRSEFDNDEGYASLSGLLKTLDAQFNTKGNRIYYLSTPPSHFPSIVEKLNQHKLLYEAHSPRFSRVVIEKPFGRDLPSALSLEGILENYLREDQMFRIDHYLGKETVQNILVFRFANSICEPLWNNKFIDHVQITVSEDCGVGTRGRLYEESGTLRDMIQNHMMQLLSLIAMEPPSTISANAIRDEKVKILSAIRPIGKGAIDRYAVRGQYGPGFIGGEAVKGYTQEENVSASSPVETYVALELFIDTWRWEGVPFYLRTGKRLPKRATEIAIFFKEPPNVYFSSVLPHQNNALILRIQPDEGISFKINSKIPGTSTLVHPVKMDFRYRSHFGTMPPDAYERLICDCMLGDQTLFARQDEVLASWKILQPILEYWQNEHPSAFPNYASGTWGPEAANRLIQQEGRVWRHI